MHIETNTKRTKNLVLLTTLDFMKSFWNHNNPTLDFIYPYIFYFKYANPVSPIAPLIPVKFPEQHT